MTDATAAVSHQSALEVKARHIYCQTHPSHAGIKHLAGYPATQAVDEDKRTWWSALTGGEGEWLKVGLQGIKRVEALQVNFADQGSRGEEISGDVYKYQVEMSVDGASWKMVVDASSGRDAPNDYRVLPQAESARFVRIRNLHLPDGGKFSLSGLRVFGTGTAARPQQVSQVTALRDAADRRKVTVSWKPAANAEFYIVRIGASRDAMGGNYQVYDGAAHLTIASLEKGKSYFAAVDAVNESGVTTGRLVLKIN